jgi:hypothetical protein
VRTLLAALPLLKPVLPMQQASQAVTHTYFCQAVSDPSCGPCSQIDEHPVADVIVPTSTGSKPDHKVKAELLMSQTLKSRCTMLSGGYRMPRNRKLFIRKAALARFRQQVILNSTL